MIKNGKRNGSIKKLEILSPTNFFLNLANVSLDHLYVNYFKVAYILGSKIRNGKLSPIY